MNAVRKLKVVGLIGAVLAVLMLSVPEYSWAQGRHYYGGHGSYSGHRGYYHGGYGGYHHYRHRPHWGRYYPSYRPYYYYPPYVAFGVPGVSVYVGP